MSYYVERLYCWVTIQSQQARDVHGHRSQMIFGSFLPTIHRSLHSHRPTLRLND
jgi:hypothetical protein